MLGRDAWRQQWIQTQVNLQFLESIGGRLESDDPSGGADEPRKLQCVGSDVRADVQHGCARSNPATELLDGVVFENTKKENGKVDPFGEIEFPSNFASFHVRNPAQTHHSTSRH